MARSEIITPTYIKILAHITANAPGRVWQGRFVDLASALNLHPVTVRTRVSEMVRNGAVERIGASDGSMPTKLRLIGRPTEAPPSPKPVEWTSYHAPCLPRRPADNALRLVPPGNHPARSFSMLGGRL